MPHLTRREEITRGVEIEGGRHCVAERPTGKMTENAKVSASKKNEEDSKKDQTLQSKHEKKLKVMEDTVSQWKKAASENLSKGRRNSKKRSKKRERRRNSFNRKSKRSSE